MVLVLRGKGKAKFFAARIALTMILFLSTFDNGKHVAATTTTSYVYLP
jgi:hypothetical protein